MQNKGYGGVVFTVLTIILVSQYNTRSEAAPRMRTNHRSSKAQIISFMGHHCFALGEGQNIHTVALLRVI